MKGLTNICRQSKNFR